RQIQLGGRIVRPDPHGTMADVAGRDLDAEELEAGSIVAAGLGGHSVPPDVPSAPPMTPDFNVILDDGTCVALEVTSTRDERVLALLATAFGRPWPATGLINDWQVGIAQPIKGVAVRVDRLMRDVLQPLAGLEQHGVHDVVYVSRWPVSRPRTDKERQTQRATIALAEMGVVLVRPLGPPISPGAPQLYVSVHGGLSANADEVNRLVVAAAEANHGKLVSTKADQRHLFVWIDPSSA